MDVSHSVLYLYICHKVSILIKQNNYFVSTHKLLDDLAKACGY